MFCYSHMFFFLYSARAGYWGSYGQCDLPIHTLEHLFKSLNQSDKVGVCVILV